MPNFHVVLGTDDFLVNREGTELWNQLAADIDDEFGREIIDGQAGNLDEVEQAVNGFIAAVNTLPMFSTSKAVWLKGVTFLADSQTGRSEGAKAQAAQLLETLETLDPSTVTVLITAAPVDRRRRETKWLEQHGEATVLFAKKGDNSGLLMALQTEAKKLDSPLGAAEAQLLAELLQGNTRLAIEELRKVATNLPEGQAISRQDIVDLVPPYGEGNFWEAAEAFFSLDLNQTLDAFRRHFFAGYDARPLLTMLQRRNRVLIQARALCDAEGMRPSPSGFSSADLKRLEGKYGDLFAPAEKATDFNVFTQNAWSLKRNMAVLPRLPMRRLLDFQEAFLEAFAELLDYGRDQESILRAMATRCLGT